MRMEKGGKDTRCMLGGKGAQRRQGDRSGLAEGIVGGCVFGGNQWLLGPADTISALCKLQANLCWLNDGGV